MLVRDIMTSPAVTVRPDEDVSEAARILDRLHITALPVVTTEGALVGVISEADVLAQLTTPHGDDASDHRVQVRDAMRHRTLTADADDDIADVIVMLTGTSLKSLPVLVQGTVRGVVSRSDIIRAVAHGGFDAPPADPIGVS